MHTWQLKEFGISHLERVLVPETKLAPHEVRVRIHACSLNFRDLMVIRGIYNPRQKLPLIPLSDGAGEVIEVGGEVKSLQVGDKVCATFSQKWCHGVANNETFQNTLGSPLDGMLSENKVFHEEGLIKFPSFLSYEEAATLPCAGVTAFNALLCQSEIKPGDTVLLLGTGGVSIFALQFAKLSGLKTILVSSSEAKINKAKELGLDHGINYTKNPDWQNQVLEYTSGKGADAVIEVGGAQTLGRSIASVKRGGVIAIIGVLTGASEPLDLRPILMNNIRLQGIFVGAKTVFDAMNRVVYHGKLRPVVDRVFSFDEAKEAFSYLETAAHFGKVVIKLL